MLVYEGMITNLSQLHNSIHQCFRTTTTLQKKKIQYISNYSV